MKRAELVTLGKVLRSHGKAGVLKVRLYDGELPDRACSRLHLQRGADRKTYQVESLDFRCNCCFIKLKGVDTLAKADQTVGSEVLVDSECYSAPAEEGNYYEYEILGCRVETVDGRAVGEVGRVIKAGPGSLLSVIDGGGREVLVPFVEQVCVRIEPDEKLIVIDPPQGLLDLNEI